jgi:subfamily B ATP-binding cassette protein MsbA
VNKLRRMVRFVTPYKWRLGFFLFTAVGFSASNSLPFLIMKRFLDIILDRESPAEQMWSPFWRAVTVLALLLLVRVYFVIRREVAQMYLSQVAVRDATDRVTAHVLDRPMAFFDRWRSGELISRISFDSAALAQTVKIFATFIREPMTMAAILATLFYMNWRLTIIAIVGLPLAAWPIAALSKRIRQASRRAREVGAERADAMVQVFGGVRVVKGFVREGFEAGSFKRTNASIFGHVMRRVRAHSNMKGILEFIGGAALIAVFVVGYFMIVGGLTTPAELLTFIIALIGFSAPMKALGEANSAVQEALPGAERLFHLLDDDMRLYTPPHPRAAWRVEREIAFEHVGFTYGREEVLKDVDLSFQAGQVNAIVGPSGSGKSTALNLIARFYDPVAGCVSVDGVDLREIDVNGWLGQIGLVTQEPFLFNTSIRDNIRYGRLDATDDEVQQAAKTANIHEEILRFDGGYEALAGERGMQLSGGQRQRICLARALLRDPAILLLDEATSSLDSTSERIVQAAIDQAQAGRTSVVVAHRLSTIKNADMIYVMVDGRVESSGSHDELLLASPTYRALWETQQGEQRASEIA